jgi:hypothetical protein
MKARINLAKFPEGRPGYYAMIENEAQYERVLNAELSYEKSKRVTHYRVPASVLERLLALDKCSEKLCGQWGIAATLEPGEETTVVCTCCHTEAHKVNDEYIYSPFCPHCGADLREDFDIEKENTND